MSNEVKRYSVRGQFDHGLNLTTTREVVLASDYAALEAECDKWHQQFNCMQLQRDHHRNTVKALRAELERVRQGSLFLLDAHAELEAARKQEPFMYATVLDGKVQQRGSKLLCQEWADAWNATDSCVENVGRAEIIPLFALPPLAGKVSVRRELLRRVCWPVVSGSDRHTHSEAVAELRALLATPSMEVKHDA